MNAVTTATELHTDILRQAVILKKKSGPCYHMKAHAKLAVYGVYAQPNTPRAVELPSRYW